MYLQSLAEKKTIFVPKRVFWQPRRTMIDINLLRADKGGNVQAVKESQRKRAGEKGVALVDEVLLLDEEWKTGTQNDPVWIDFDSPL